MKHYMKILIIIILPILITSCGYKPRVGGPTMQKLMRDAPDGPPLFKKGWKEGCETGISATSNRMIRHFYTFQQDYRYAQNKEYYTGWKSAYDFCQRYVFQYLRRQYF